MKFLKKFFKTEHAPVQKSAVYTFQIDLVFYDNFNNRVKLSLSTKREILQSDQNEFTFTLAIEKYLERILDLNELFYYQLDNKTNVIKTRNITRYEFNYQILKREEL